jgi:hypothetical protein
VISARLIIGLARSRFPFLSVASLPAAITRSLITVNEILNRIYAAVDYVSNLENQDEGLALEMSQQMLSDLINNGEIKPMIEYISRYCDVTDSAEDAQRIADDI